MLEQLGPYRIGEQIGKGGMGSVYRAEHVETGEVAAVKALAPHLGMAEGFRERFEAEIESLKKLRHEGIVRLHGYGEQDDILFYAMEFVDGTSLEDEIAAGRRFNWREVTQISIQVCRALKHAHDHGVVHRDIKPANLLLDGSENVKIADFGIARLFGGTQLTSAGGVLGTADYMSPEQADGRAVTDRCDQYSLGGVMYALLAGRPPFRAKNLPEMLQLQRFAEPEPVRRLAPDAPEQLERVISQLLDKEPDKRFRNVLSLGRHLEAMLKALSRPAKDDFHLAHDVAEGGSFPAQSDPSLALEATRVEPTIQDVASRGSTRPNDASVVAPPRQAADGTARTGALTGPVTHRAADDEELCQEESVDLAPLPADVEREEAERVAKRSRFTTVEEEARREREGEGTPLVAQAAKIIALVAAIGGITWGIRYLTRPATSGELYATITEAASGTDVKQLRAVDDEISEFLKRFPDDPRADEVASHRVALENADLERRLDRIASRGGYEPGLLPAEQVYVDAIRLVGQEPNEAIGQLSSILALYQAEEDANNDDPVDTSQTRIEALLRLIRHRLAKYRRREATTAESHLVELNERLETAAELAKTDAAGAMEVYRAIVNLYSNRPWASKVVEQARSELQRLEDRGDTQRR